MHKKITFRSMAHSQAIENYIFKKILKIDKFFKREPQPIFLNVTLEPHREKHFFKVEFKLDTLHYHCFVKTEGVDMYSLIDNAMSKMIKDITRRKEILGHQLHLSYV